MPYSHQLLANVANANEDRKNLIAYYSEKEREFLRGLCRYSSIDNEVLQYLTAIDNDIDVAVEKRYLDPLGALVVSNRIKNILETANRFAQENLSTTSDVVPRNFSKEGSPTPEESTHQLGIMTSLHNQLTELNVEMKKLYHTPPARNMCEKIITSVNFLVRNLIFGSIAVVLTGVGMGAFFLLSACMGCLPPSANYTKLIYSAWGSKPASARLNLYQTTDQLVNRLNKPIYNWRNGPKEPGGIVESFFDFLAGSNPKAKTEEEKNQHLAAKQQAMRI